jgi:hypothetical protein
MKTKFTHTGTVSPCSAACMGTAYTTKLRETTRWWVTETGRKFNKHNGWAVGVKWPLWMLDIATIQPIITP